MNNKNDFKKVANKKTIKNLLEKCRTELLQVVLWSIESGKKITNNYKISIMRADKRELVLIREQNDNTPIIRVESSRNNFYIAELGIFFQADKINEKDGHLHLILPNMLVQVERRKDIRMRISEHQPINCLFKKKFNNNIIRTFEKNCFDLSAGGLSVIVSKSERDLFNIGDIIDNFEIFINHVRIKFEAEIVNFVVIEPDAENRLIYAGYKLCLKFFQIGEDEKSMIENYVFYTIEDSLKDITKAS